MAGGEAAQSHWVTAGTTRADGRRMMNPTSVLALVTSATLLGCVTAEDAQPELDSVESAVSGCFPTVDAKYLALGGTGSWLGAPLSSVGDGKGTFRAYAGGVIYAFGCAFEVHGGILDKWSGLARQAGPMGYPIVDESGSPDGIGRYNTFQYGAIYWTPWTGAWSVQGKIYEIWRATGLELGALGSPISDEQPTYLGRGRVSDFQNGSIYWQGYFGTWTVMNNPIGRYYRNLGAERSWLGYPTSDEYTALSNRIQQFDNGTVVWRPDGTVGANPR